MVQGGRRGTSEIQHRVDLGYAALHRHWKFWGSKKASLSHKLTAYRIDVIILSVLMHGYESWHLDLTALKTLNGFDLRAQMQITGWDYKTVENTRKFVLAHCIRVRRLAFLGHTLRLPPTELIHKTLKDYHHFLQSKLPASSIYNGTVFMDAPRHASFAALVTVAEDRTTWRGFAKNISSANVQRRYSSRVSARFARPAAAL